MNNLKKILGTIGLVVTLGLSGCRDEEIEYSPVLHENAIVSYKDFKPAKTNDMRVGRVVSRKVYPAEYNIFLDGKIRFELDNKKIFAKFKTNDQADVSYKEKYKVIYNDTNNDGTNDLIKKYFMDAEFIDAQPITDRILDRF